MFSTNNEYNYGDHNLFTLNKCKNDKKSQNNVDHGRWKLQTSIKRLTCKKAFLLQWTIMNSSVNKDRKN